MSDLLRGEVEHVDENQAEGYKEDDPSRYDVRRDEEGDPAHHHEHPRGQVDRENERTQGARKNYLHAVNTIISCTKHLVTDC